MANFNNAKSAVTFAPAFCCSVTQSCPTLCNPMDCSMPGLPVPHHLPKFAQVHVHCIGDAIQPSHPLMPSSSALNLSQHQRLFQWVSCLHKFSSVTQSCWTLCNPMDCSTPGLPVHHQLLELAQTHVHWVGDAIQPSCSLSSPSLPSIFPSIRDFSNELALCIRWRSVLELQFQHQSFQWVFRVDFL